MTVKCFVRIDEGTSEGSAVPSRTFQTVPRVGEFVAFSRDDQRDENGVLHADLFQVKHVIHAAGNDRNDPSVHLDVVPWTPGTVGSPK